MTTLDWSLMPAAASTRAQLIDRRQLRSAGRRINGDVAVADEAGAGHVASSKSAGLVPTATTTRRGL